MKYKDTGFRAVYHNFCVLELNDNIKKIIYDLPGSTAANGVLTYGYYDRDAGLTLEILATAQINGQKVKFAPGNNEITLKLRIGSVEDTEFYIYPDRDGELAKQFADKLDMIKGYDASDEIEETRKMTFLDPCRDKYFIDDVLVRLIKTGLQPEGCWTRIIGLGDHFFVGNLLNEPDQDFGFHEGDEIAFFVHKTDDDEIFCYTDMNPSKAVTAEELEGGEMLKEAIARFNAERNQDNLVDVLEILRDSYVWVPCTAVFSDEDNAMVEKMLEETDGDYEQIIGETITSKDEVRLIPDILQNGDAFFFPVFSSAEEMGEYGDNFSKIEKHILEIIPLARNNEKKVAGIVVNAFSNDPFVIDAGIFDLIEQMKSRIQTT